MPQQIFCISCRKRITNKSGTAIFLCPKCSKEEIVRCKHCREITASYICTACQFAGP